MVEDMSGAPLTQSKGVSESCRWMAPELLMGETQIMTTYSDVWSLGMTILEVCLPNPLLQFPVGSKHGTVIDRAPSIRPHSVKYVSCHQGLLR
jgi:serine/threonine protein kinase